MAWKIEKWTVDICPPGSQPLANYRDLRFRELVIVLAADLDAALAELLSKRLFGEENELIELLGANEDGRATAGAFGSRIQLARAVGLLCANESHTLRIIKSIRNLAAHRVKTNYASKKVQQLMGQLWDGLKSYPFDDGSNIADAILQKWTGRKNRAVITNLAFGRRVLIGAALALQLAFWEMHNNMKPIELMMANISATPDSSAAAKMAANGTSASQ